MQRIGNRAPMYCTGIGKLLLCGHTADEVRRIVREKGMNAFTPNTITDEDALFSELAAVRERGYAFDNEECEIGARCIAMPITRQNGQIAAGISITGPIFRLTDERIAEFLPYFKAQAERISALMM